MSAHLMVLEEFLLAPMLAGAISPAEAWAVQDLYLLQQEEWVRLPPSYLSVAQLLLLFHRDPVNLLPL